MIPSVDLSEQDNPYNAKKIERTTDKVFMLSVGEVYKYFGSEKERRCRGTAYCYEQGALKNDNGNCWWWVRSQGNYSYNAAYFRSNGDYFHYGHNVDYTCVAVRPAIWIELR